MSLKYYTWLFNAPKKTFFRFQPHLSHSSRPSPHATHTGLLLFPQSMPGSSMTQIHQKCFSSHLLTCLAKLYSSLKIHIKYYSFGKTCGFIHIVLLYPLSQSSLFIIFMALITFNFTHNRVCSSQLWLNVKFIWGVRKIIMSKPHPRPIHLESLKHVSRRLFNFVFKEELRTLTHYFSQCLAQSRPSSHVNLHKWHKTRSLRRRWSLLTQREEQRLVGTVEWHGQRAFYRNGDKKHG